MFELKLLFPVELFVPENTLSDGSVGQISAGTASLTFLTPEPQSIAAFAFEDERTFLVSVSGVPGLEDRQESTTPLPGLDRPGLPPP